MTYGEHVISDPTIGDVLDRIEKVHKDADNIVRRFGAQCADRALEAAAMCALEGNVPVGATDAIKKFEEAAKACARSIAVAYESREVKL